MAIVAISPGSSLDLGSVVVPGSKSHTIRALFAAGGARGESALLGGLESEDTVAARRVLSKLGVGVVSGTGSWAISGTAGLFGRPNGPLDVGESGLTARYVIAFAALVSGKVAIVGSGRLPQRPMKGVLDAVRSQGATVDFAYPWSVKGTGSLPGGLVEVDATMSSQMLSAVLMTAPLAQKQTTVQPLGLVGSQGYIDLTVEVMSRFGASVSEVSGRWVVDPTGYAGTTYTVPPDASAAVYPLVAGAITRTAVTVPGDFGRQPDRRVTEVLRQMGCEVTDTEFGIHLQGPETLRGIDVDMSTCPDAAVAISIACVVADGPSRIRGLSSLRLKESDRLMALKTELEKVRATVDIDDGAITVRPGRLTSVRFDPHNDHRIAMSLALLGLLQPGIEIKDSQVVNKTWPGYWSWLERTGAIVTK